MLFQTEELELSGSFRTGIYHGAQRTAVGELLGLFDGWVLHELFKRLVCHIFEVLSIAQF